MSKPPSCTEVSGLNPATGTATKCTMCSDRGLFRSPSDGVSYQLTEDLLFWALSPGWAWVARLGAPIAAILIPSAFFLSVVSPTATEVNALIYLVIPGAVSLAAAVITLKRTWTSPRRTRAMKTASAPIESASSRIESTTDAAWFLERSDAYERIHRPRERSDWVRAQQRFRFEEAFVAQAEALASAGVVAMAIYRAFT